VSVPPVFNYPFAIPGQYIGQWIGFDPTSSAPFVFISQPGFALGSVWIPNLSDGVNLFVGTTASGLPFYTTGSTGSENVPLPSGTQAVTLQSVDGSGAIMSVFITSLAFDPIKTSPASPSVASVTGTSPIAVTSGANPVVSLATPLAVSFGGSGSVSPSLQSGTGISITGTWPNQTISTTASSGVTSVAASAPIASSGGTTPTISLSGIVPVANGGTGTSSPSIVAGTNITVTGTWPNQTISAAASAAAMLFNGAAANQVIVQTGTVTLSPLATQTITHGATYTSSSTYVTLLQVSPSGSSYYNHPIYVTAGSQTTTAFGLTNPDSFYTESCVWVTIGY
jgi:hypothetical protein